MAAGRTIKFHIHPQPNDITCGPTCLHAVYRYYGDSISLERVISEVRSLKEGGTLATLLACHALKRGYHAIIYSYNLSIFDPTWFNLSVPELKLKLKAQAAVKKQGKLRIASKAYLSFLDLGGKLIFNDLTTALIRRYMKSNMPIITGLSATYLYQSPREYGFNGDYDDIRGEPAGHFVVLCGYNREKHTIRIADPLLPNPYADGNIYDVSSPRLICSILLGVLTYDAKLLIIKPKKDSM